MECLFYNKHCQNDSPFSFCILQHPPFLSRYLDLGPLQQVDLSGVGAANEKNKEAVSKGIKAYFNMDDSGILTLDKVSYRFYFSDLGNIVETFKNCSFS